MAAEKIEQVEHYTVVLENQGCSHCGAGKMWDIVDSDGFATGTSYGSDEDAQDVCDDMNMAFNRGREDRVAGKD